MSKGRLTVRTNRARERFLGVLSKRCNVTAACRAAGISRQTAYAWKDEEPAFAEAWESAVEIAVDRLHDEAWRRAHDGVDRPVYYKGAVVGHIKEYSDRMLELLLQAHDPSRFRRHADIAMLGGSGAFIGLVVVGPGGEAGSGNGKVPGDGAKDITPRTNGKGGNGHG